jgi:hypothetical protein
VGSDRRSTTFGVIVFVILVVGAWFALREVGSEAVHKVTSPQPPISFPKPPISVTPPTWNCQPDVTSAPAATAITPIASLCDSR